VVHLETRNLTKRFGRIVAADSVSLSLERGRVLCLLGPSGCGKTTTLRMIAGLTDPDEGSVWLDGESITRLPTFRRRIGMVFQNWALFPHLTVFENIAFGLRIQGSPPEEIRRRAQEVLALVRLPDVGSRRPAQLSGGQQQRVALARTLVTNPRFMLFDEPLSNLDLKLRQEMRAEIRRIQRELGLTAVYVTHDQGEALSLGDQVAVMRGGRVLEVGPPADLFERPRTVYVADFLGVENILSGRLLSDASVFEIQGGLRVGVPRVSRNGAVPRAIGLRAENIGVSPARQPDGLEQYSGVVTDLDFQGSKVLYVVRVEGTAVHLKASHTGTRRFAVGEAVYVAWHPEQTLTLTEA
jgi:ABC-type Fe3+/spermidine/putrescine transport system ATPase subunit